MKSDRDIRRDVAEAVVVAKMILVHGQPVGTHAPVGVAPNRFGVRTTYRPVSFPRHMRSRWITDWTASARWPHYTRANAGEVLPTPASPLGWSFSWEKGMILGWANGYARSGNYDRWEMDARRPEVIGSFGGYFYINLSNVRMQGVRNPAVTVEQLDLAFFGADPNVPPYTTHPDDEQPEYTDRILAHLGWVMTATEWPEIDAHRAAASISRRARECSQESCELRD